MSIYVAAIDLGASSGRIMLGRFCAASRQLELDEVHRFPNQLIRQDGHDCWDIEALVTEIQTGLAKLDAQGVELASIGIDTWGVDYVLLDKNGQRLGPAIAYRDHRTDGVPEQFMQRVSREEIYRRTGIQFLQFNTLFQLQALKWQQPSFWNDIDKLLLIPDYLHYRLCGVMSCEYTNATTTQLLNVQTGDWDPELLQAVGLPRHWFLKPSQPGTRLGTWSAPSGRKVPVILPATHDTGSAVVAAPLLESGSAYISSGTWSLAGIESVHPLTGTAALQANLTNEGGVDGTFRVLKNIMGLWLIQRLRAELGSISFAELAEQAAEAPGFAYLINPNDAVFLNPPSMREAIQQYCEQTGQGRPQHSGELARCVFDSLALLYRQSIEELEATSQQAIHRIHIVGGGAHNRLLNQLCADICARPVMAGPTEASALGNLGCQLKGLGLIDSVSELRQLIADNFCGDHFEPRTVVHLEHHWQRFCALSQWKTESRTQKEPA